MHIELHNHVVISRCERLYSCSRSGKGTHCSSEEAEVRLRVQGTKEKKQLKTHLEFWPFCIIVFASVGLQPRDRQRLLCAADGKGHGEGIGQRGE